MEGASPAGGESVVRTARRRRSWTARTPLRRPRAVGHRPRVPGAADPG